MSTLDDRHDVKSRAKEAYDGLEVVWPNTDAWSTHTRRNIAKLIKRTLGNTRCTILNAGCGNNDYGLSGQATCVNLDMSLRQCRKMERAIVADIESIPLAANYFDAIVCVGAVLNYAEPYNAIPELARVTKPGGLILLDFETTNTAELLLSSDWSKRVSVIERYYAGRLDKTFLFSAQHIKTILAQHKIEIIAEHRYHLATALWHRAFSNARLPIAVLSLDWLLSRVPGLRNLASNVIFLCRKSGSARRSHI
jgi:ubiquinone/menaquinone biosynthesis C-methylase UbiE